MLNKKGKISSNLIHTSYCVCNDITAVGSAFTAKRSNYSNKTALVCF